jgi:ATP-dependent exoDNAse (exonuclease V) beta subunit
MNQLDDGPADLCEAIATLLLWRDNSWQELEDELIKMLSKRDRWMQGFVFNAELDESLLRSALERPFARAAMKAMNQICELLDESDCNQIDTIAQAAYSNLNGERFAALANCPSLYEPTDIDDVAALEAALAAFQDLASMLLTKEGQFRAKFTKTEGFPTTAKNEKALVAALVESFSLRPGFREALDAFRSLPPIHYSDDEWRIVRACFVLLRHAAAHLKTIFSEVAKCDFVEVAQIAQQALAISEGAFTVADDIRHLLVDEFQDTSRRQHRLLADLIAHWQDREGRTCFFVGDPRQSIYFFRDADAELFPRVQNVGLELGEGDSLLFTKAQLTANFRTEPALVDRLNSIFEQVFANDDGSGITHTHAVAARQGGSAQRAGNHCSLHPEFVPAPAPFKRVTPDQVAAAAKAKSNQLHQIVELVQSLQPRVQKAQEEGKKFRIAVLGRAHKALLPIAEALRSTGIPFRAIDLEPLAERPEVTDVLNLARAFLNPEDRVAWLGVLRAPWCGLSLEELHTLTSADDPAIVSRPVSELASERFHLLNAGAQIAVRRILDVSAEAAYLRASQPTQALGAWLEMVWQRVGGAGCVDAQGRANVDLLWAVLDQLPNGEQDLLGPALNSALRELKAQPDPAASSSYGVQLLTIHKSKGLEFEVVIIPDLQAQSGGAKLNMLSWLERGLSEDVDPGQPTEFLVAPFSLKGATGGATKKWVDTVYRDRERQEMRRLLYVAATRARDELHLFARPGYKENPEDGSRSLLNPPESLLATAWPALEAEVRAQFEALQWTNSTPNQPQPVSADGPTTLRRLPATFSSEGTIFPGISLAAEGEEHGNALYSRESGSAESRVLGRAVHTLLEQLALWRSSSLSWDDARAALPNESARLVAQMRAAGLTRTDAERLTGETLAVATATTNDTLGQWVIDSHPEAGSEISWTGVLGGVIRTVQADRVFRCGPAPLQAGTDWWVVDFKTAILDQDADPAALVRLRSVFSPQLDVYSRVLRQLHGDAITIHAGLYYPRMQKFDWWDTSAF